jgi:hypothetical protein
MSKVPVCGWVLIDQFPKLSIVQPAAPDSKPGLKTMLLAFAAGAQSAIAHTPKVIIPVLIIANRLRATIYRTISTISIRALPLGH